LKIYSAPEPVPPCSIVHIFEFEKCFKKIILTKSLGSWLFSALGLFFDPKRMVVVRGSSIKDVTHLGGGGICQKVMLLQKRYLVKWVAREKEESQISKNG